MSDAEMPIRLAVAEREIDHIQSGMARLENKLDAGFARIEAKLDRTEARLDRTEVRFDGKFQELAGQVTRVEARLDKFFLWLLGLILSGFAGILLAFAKGFKWL